MGAFVKEVTTVLSQGDEDVVQYSRRRVRPKRKAARDPPP